MNEYDLFFNALATNLEELFHSKCFSYLALFVVLLITISMTRFILRCFTFYSRGEKQVEKQVFTEKDIS